MANTARVTATQEWQNLEDMIENFAPEAEEKFQLQNVGSKDLQIYEGATAPTEERNGFVIPINKGVIYTKKDGQYCFVKSKENTTVINIASL